MHIFRYMASHRGCQILREFYFGVSLQLCKSISTQGEQQRKNRCPLAKTTVLVWWPGTESNHRHADFQSAALPTELPGQDRQYNSPGAGYRREAKKFAALRLKFGPFLPLTGRCPAA
jgi:hypothetical protein